MCANDSQIELIHKDEIDYNSILVHIKDHSYRYIGRGSGRNVYDLDNNYVAKVARNRKGIAQNKVEHYISAQGGEDILAHTVGKSDDSRIVIMEKADRITRIQEVYEYYGVKDSSQLYTIEEIQNLSKQYGLVVKDFGRASNWGMIDNIPKIIDYGFTIDVRRRYYGIL